MCNLRYVFIYLFFSFVLLCALNGKEKRGFIYFFLSVFFLLSKPWCNLGDCTPTYTEAEMWWRSTQYYSIYYITIYDGEDFTLPVASLPHAPRRIKDIVYKDTLTVAGLVALVGTRVITSRTFPRRFLMYGGTVEALKRPGLTTARHLKWSGWLERFKAVNGKHYVILILIILLEWWGCTHE